MRNLLSDAALCAGLGWAVFPVHSPDGDACDCRKADCASPAKHPRTKNGLLDATTETDKIVEWWGMWPHANIGVRTGPESGIVVVDIDPRDGGDAEWMALLKEHGDIEGSPVVSTGGGGWHYYFKHPGKRVLSRKLTGQMGIDIKADGGYVIGPPSVHITGVSYEWCDGRGPDLEVPAIPGWLMAMMETAPERTERSASGDAEPIPQGQRNARLTSEGGAVRRRGASEGEIFAYLMAVNEQRCIPPLDRTEVAKIAASVYRYEPTAEGELVVDIGRPSRPERGRRPDPYVPSPFTAAELQTMELPEIKWAVPGLLPEGLALFAGRQKLGKSWWSFNLGICVAEGGIAFGEFPVEDGDALILALEDNRRRLKSRMQMMLGDEQWPERLSIETRWPRLNEGGVEAIDSWLGQHPQARLVVIDTLAKFRPRAEQGGKRGDVYAEDYAVMEGLQEMAGRHGVAVVLITHYNKAFHDDWTNAITGSTGLTGAADTLLGLERPRGKDGQKECVLHLTGRDVEEQDYAMAFDAQLGRWTLLGQAEASQASRATAELIETMQKIGHPVSPEEIAAALGVTRPTAYKRLYRAALDGFVVEIIGGKLYGLKSDDNNLDLEGVKRPPEGPKTDDFGGARPSVRLSARRTKDSQGQKDSADTADKNLEDRYESALQTPAEIAAGGRVIDHTADKTGLSAAVRAVRGSAHPCPSCGLYDHMSLRVGSVYRCDVCAPAVVPIRPEVGM